ncbi:hypothetical protein NLM33_47975 (plasmid) [Bradyrhizobium sp. CCGUVB1N3]|uniref:VirE2 family protein n=1 Tax=Bradyrhizobium sp. CCGUVB1N3 TaxID=2949629 RepID=UPI0020B235AE|nr:hypothetical protein [Bradyrhizobium sp. CCGUVB1N3]MCP3477835.1 hypothetical protein [Bradyrhizobium sp. CCGUVB1N3]
MADDDEVMPQVGDDYAKRFAALKLSAARRTVAARLPSNDDLLIAVADTTLRANGIQTVPLNSEDSENRSRKKNVHTFFTGADFQALPKLGNKTAKQMDEQLIYIKYEGNYYTKNTLWNAIKVPHNEKHKIDYKNAEFRKLTTSLGLTAERDNRLFESGKTEKRDKDGKIVLKDGKPEIIPTYKLDGEAQLYNTPAGKRRRAFAHQDPHTSGEQAPDIMLRMKNGVMKGFSRLPDDAYQECTAWDLEAALDGVVWLKSTLHGYQTIDFIERTLGPEQATHRLRDYVGESRGYNQDTHSAYVKIDTIYFPIKEVVQLMPGDEAVQAVQGPPSMEAMDHRMIIRMPEGNTFVTPDFLAGRFPEYFQEVCKEHGINPQWGTFKPDWNKMLDKYASHDRVLVEVDAALVEGHSIKLSKGESIMETYAAKQIFYADDGSARGVTYTKPSFTSLALTLQRADQEKNKGTTLDVPASVTERLLSGRGTEAGSSSNTSKPQPPPSSRYEDRNDRLRDISRSC